MTSLHVMLALILVYLQCLAAVSPLNIELNYKDMKTRVKNIENKECDAELYSPNDIECIKENLNCTQQELQTVIGECFNSPSNEYKNLQRLNDLIYIRLNAYNASNSANENCFCESQSTPKKPYKDFLQHILHLVTQLNSKS